MALKKTRNTIIEAALDLIGVKASEEPLSSSETQDAATALDHMVKTFQSSGAHLWNRDSFTVFLEPSQYKYVFGTAEATTSFTETTLSADAAAAATTVSLTSTTGLALSDRIGIKLDSGSLHWTTIKNLTGPVLTDAMPSLATSGNAVYYYTTKITKVLRIPDARRVTGTGTSTVETMMVQLGREDYLNLPNKQNTGPVTQYYYDPKISSGDLYVWPSPTSTETYINCTGYFPLDVFSDADDSPDFPDEWIEALIYQLAVRMAPRFGQPLPAEVAVLAEKFLEDAMNWDQDDASVFFGVG